MKAASFVIPLFALCLGGCAPQMWQATTTSGDLTQPPTNLARDLHDSFKNGSGVNAEARDIERSLSRR